MSIKSKLLGVIVLVSILGGIGLTMAFNLWSTESSKVPATFKQGDLAGQYNPGDIRGSYSFADINKSFNIPVDVMAKAFNVTGVNDASSFKAKDLETIYAGLKEKGTEIGTSSIRLFVALYNGLPYEPDEETYLLSNAVDILKQQGRMSKEQADYVESHTVDISSVIGTEVKVDSSQQSKEEENIEKIVKGKTTFKEVLDFGVKKEDIEEIIGEKIPGPGVAIRDYCQQKGVEFSVVKEALQNKIDTVK